jgi:HSP20 family protein
MSLIRWEPLTGAEDIFSRLMPQMFGRFPRMSVPGNGDAKFEWAPSADISETDKEFLIRAELPAVKKEDVNVTVDQGMITIQGERKQEREDKAEKYHRVESFHGTFSRSFSLPENVDADAIRCESKDGVLIVHIPKVQAVLAKAAAARDQAVAPRRSAMA